MCWEGREQDSQGLNLGCELLGHPVSQPQANTSSSCSLGNLWGSQGYLTHTLVTGPAAAWTDLGAVQQRDSSRDGGFWDRYVVEGTFILEAGVFRVRSINADSCFLEGAEAPGIKPPGPWLGEIPRAQTHPGAAALPLRLRPLRAGAGRLSQSLTWPHINPAQPSPSPHSASAH